jgi:hypothetical protein
VVNFNVVDPVAVKDWDASILKFNNVSFFHSSPWARLLSDSYQFKPMYCIASANGNLGAVLPLMEVRSILGEKKAVSLPFSDFCQPLYIDQSKFDDLFAFVIRRARENKWRSVTIRGNAPLNADVPVSESYYRHILLLAKEENDLYKSFRNSTQRNIKKAIASNASVTFDSTLDSVNAFYRLNCLARRDHGLPPQPYFFFDHFYHNIIAKGHGEVALARSGDNRIVSASIFLHFGKTVHYKYGASNSQGSDSRANYLVMWEAIRRYNARHYDTFCFGRTETAHKGLLQFKTGWGTMQQTINNYCYHIGTNTFIRAPLSTSGIHNAIFRHMPMSVLKALSFILYRYMG